MRAWVLAFLLAAMCGVVLAQEPAPMEKPTLKFETAVIKPSEASATEQTMQGKPHGWMARGTSVFEMMTYAFDAHHVQFAEVPKWAEDERFDIDAVPEMQTQPNREQFHEMLRSLLIERFGLKLTRTTKELPAYAIRIDKGGPKMTRSQAPLSVPPSWGYEGAGHLRATDFPMTGMVRILQWNALERPVVDQTGLTGRYNWELRWRPDALAAGAEGSDLPDLFTATREQLGLKLERTNAPVTVWVVDRVDRPTPN